MSPPLARIFNLEDAAPGAFPGAITITSTQRVNIWHQKIVGKFKKIVANCDEKSLIRLAGNYRSLVQDQINLLMERHLLRDRIADHLYVLYVTFNRLQEEKSIKTTEFLDIMEKLLSIACDLELETTSLMRHKPLSFIAQTIIDMIHFYLFDNVNRMLHVILSLSERYVRKQSYKAVMNLVYRHFVITIPINDTSDLNFCLYYLIYQKWKKTKTEGSCLSMDKYMYLAFNKSPEDVLQSKTLRKVLKPSYNEMPGFDANINGLTPRIHQYFKHFDLEKKNDDNCISENHDRAEGLEYYDPFAMDFVHLLVIKTSTTIGTKSNQEILQASYNDDVIAVDNDSDVEIVPLVQNGAGATVTLCSEIPLNVPTTTNNVTCTATSVVASDLVDRFSTLFGSNTRKQTNLENENLYTSSVLNASTSFLDIDLYTVITTIVNGLPFNPNNEVQFSVAECLQPKIDTDKQPTKEIDNIAADHETSNKINNLSEIVVEHTMQLEMPLEPIGDESHKEVQPTKDFLSNNEIRINGDVRLCANCFCHSSEKQNSNSNPPIQETEHISKPSKLESKTVEIQTDNSITLTNVYNFHNAIETRSSSLENFISPATNSYSFINSVEEYVKEDIAPVSEFYSESNNMSLKNGDCATQVYPEQLEIIQDDIIKTQEESVDSFHYTTTEALSTLASIENKLVDEISNELENDLLINNTSICVDNSIKLSVLEPVLDNEDKHKEFISTSNNSKTSAILEVCLEKNSSATNSANDKLLTTVALKKKINRRHKKYVNKSYKVSSDSNISCSLSAFDNFTAHANEIKDISVPKASSNQSVTVTDSNDLVDGSKSKSDSTVKDLPSPVYETIFQQDKHEFRKHLSEVKKGKRTGILKTSNPNINVGTESYNNPNEEQDNSSISHLRSSISTRAASKRKHYTYGEEVIPKRKRVNFAETDSVVHASKEQHRRISNAVIDYAKDSMYVHNIHKQDNKLIYLEPCIPITIMPYAKFIEEYGERQINSFNRNVNNIFFKEKSTKTGITVYTVYKINIKKALPNTDGSSSHSPSRGSTVRLLSANETGFSRIQQCCSYSSTKGSSGHNDDHIKSEAINEMVAVKCESPELEEIVLRQPRILLRKVDSAMITKMGSGSSTALACISVITNS